MFPRALWPHVLGKTLMKRAQKATGKMCNTRATRKPRKRSPFLSSSQRLIVLVGGVFSWASSDRAMLHCGVDGKMINPSTASKGWEWVTLGTGRQWAVGRTVGAHSLLGCQKDPEPHPPCLDITFWLLSELELLV